MPFERTILKELRRWSERENRKPLILRGARQVGKTTAVKLFSQSFDFFIDLNLEKPDDKTFFSRFERLEDTLSALFFQRNISPKGKRVLLFLDEIQSEPKAVAQLRYFYEQFPELYVVAAGSLLETLLEPKNTFPVGRVEYLVMRPVSFLEFLKATGEDLAAEALLQVPLPAFALPKLLNLFHTYALIGGMPEAVQQFALHRDLVALQPVFSSLLTAYLDDVQKYAAGELRSQVLSHCIRQVFREAGKRIKLEGFGQSNYGSREIGEALRTLEKAMLLHLVYPTTELQLPALPNLRKSPYLQALDTGLMNFFSGLQAEIIGTKDLQEAYRSRVAHHWAGQQLLTRMASPLQNLQFWVREKKQSEAEVDFVIPFENLLVPVEVKSGAAGKLRSLHQFMDLCDHELAVRLYAGDLILHKTVTGSGKPFFLLNLPYFLAERIDDYLPWMKMKIAEGEMSAMKAG